jgi:hypothetical protein
MFKFCTAHVLSSPSYFASCNQLTSYVDLMSSMHVTFVYLIMKLNFAHLFVLFLLNKSD